MHAERLRKRRDFLEANKGKRWQTPGFVLLAYRRPDDAADTSPRIGFTVTRKIGSAVVRNRLKRRLRHLARPLVADMGAAGVDYVLIGRAAGVTAAWDMLGQDLRRGLQRIGRGQ